VIENRSHWWSKEVSITKLLTIKNFWSLYIWWPKMGFGHHLRRLDHWMVTKTFFWLPQDWRSKIFNCRWLNFEKMQVICFWKNFNLCYTWQPMVTKNSVTSGKTIIVSNNQKGFRSPNCWWLKIFNRLTYGDQYWVWLPFKKQPNFFNYY
jgi:hypothetical protein